MTTNGSAARHPSKSFLITFGLAVAFLAGDAANSPSSAQKEQFERTKPHDNVGTIGHVDNENISARNTTKHRFDNLAADGVRDFLSPAQSVRPRRVRRHTFRRKNPYLAVRRRSTLRARRR